MNFFLLQILPSLPGEVLDQAIELAKANVANISFGAAFFGGALMFFSPCVFPIFISFIASNFSSAGADKNRHLKAALAFFGGFFIIFLALGFSVTFFGQFFTLNRESIIFIAGIFLIILGILNIWQKGFAILPKGAEEFLRKRYFGNFFLGLFATAGLSPCVGPILFAILFLSASTQNYFQTFLLILSFVFGIAAPFLIISNFFDRLEVIKKIPFRFLNVLAGSILISLGAIYIIFGGAGILTRDVLNIWPYIYVLQSRILASPSLTALLSGIFATWVIAFLAYLIKKWYNKKYKNII